MDRSEHVGEIIDAWHRIKQALCVRFAKTETHLPHSQWAVLNSMTGRQSATVKDIAEALAISGSAATQLVNELVAKGYLSKKQHPGDKRSVLLACTPRCAGDLHKLRAEAIVYSSDIFKTLTDDELATYVRLTKKITS